MDKALALQPQELRAVEGLKAMADPNRMHIVTMLSNQEMCAIELLRQLEISQPTLSHHMKVLILASIVKTRKSGAQVYYTVNAAKLEKMPPIWRRRFLTWGIAIAVFGMRFVFPIVIVAAFSGISR